MIGFILGVIVTMGCVVAWHYRTELQVWWATVRAKK